MGSSMLAWNNTFSGFWRYETLGHYFRGCVSLAGHREFKAYGRGEFIGVFNNLESAQRAVEEAEEAFCAERKRVNAASKSTAAS